MKRSLSLWILMVLVVLTAACSQSEVSHTCTAPCSVCGLCLNDSCVESVCLKKCPGHHECRLSCTECGLCTDGECQELVCVNKCLGHHKCNTQCLECGLCLNEDCAESECQEKCGTHWEEPYFLSNGDYVTTEPVTIDTGIMMFKIGENVFVPGHLAQMTEHLVASLEEITGLQYNGSNYARQYYSEGKINVNVSRDSLYVGADWYMGLDTSELGRALACLPPTDVDLAPGDLFLAPNYAIVHEFAHTLMYRQNEWAHSQLLDEGFAEYTTYLLLREWADSAPDEAFYLDLPVQILMNQTIYDYEALYAQPLEYWLENTFEHSGNANYSIGFRFMAYLHQVYGDYTRWITAFSDVETDIDRLYFNSAPEQQTAVLKAVYGEDVLVNFYPWLQANLEQFDENQPALADRDLTAVESVNLYPTYDAICRKAWIKNFRYKDLYINIDTVRRYVEEYKGGDGTGLVLITSEPVQVRLYNADGTYRAVMTGQQPDGISLENISYIKLVGEGRLSVLEVAGKFSIDTQ